MKKYLNNLNIITAVQILSVVLVSIGILPRFLILPLTILVSFYILLSPAEDSIIFFARSVPFFVAIPFTGYFDSFNMWRIASGLIFIKWFFKKEILFKIFRNIREFLHSPLSYYKKYLVSVSVSVFLAASLFSLFSAEDLISGIKRIIYLVNLSLIGFVIYDVSKNKVEFSKRIIVNILIPGVLITAIGFLQLFSTYLMTIYQFIDFWGDKVQRYWYGSNWADIAISSNTWFAYFGQQLSLRMFSVFPDSHTFPMFLLFSIPSLLALSLQKVIIFSSSWRKMIRTRASLWIIALPFMYLAAILSGTRGIWLAVLGPILFLPIFLKQLKEKSDKKILTYVASFFAIFFLLFLVANPILTSSQFKVPKGDNELLRERIKSILNLEETSNSGRIYIWKETVKSIIKNPILGVGIGNFPTVLKQNSEFAKAGSSAHNLYFNIIAEIGIFGFLASLVFLWQIFKKGINFFKNTADNFLKIYSGSFLLYLTWVLFYSLTDAALFDERAFLIFIINTSLIFGLDSKEKSP